MKAPALTTPQYVAARLRAVLKREGFPLSKTTGRYSPFDSSQIVTPGFKVARVGVSKSVAVHYRSSTRLMSDEDRATYAAGLAALCAAGYPVDERGWVTCEFYGG